MKILNNNLQRKNFPVSDPLGEVDAHVLVLVGDLQDPLDDDVFALQRALKRNNKRFFSPERLFVCCKNVEKAVISKLMRGVDIRLEC